jgi:hypothetical protein
VIFLDKVRALKSRKNSVIKIPAWAKVRLRWFGMQPFERWAGVITSAYLSLFLIVVIARSRELFSLPLNELGDFAAGVFGPPAFLWLVLGYRQQGRELRESSSALRSQSAELKKSVELQAISIETQEKMNDPILDFLYDCIDPRDGNTPVFKIKNNKNTCYGVSVSFDTEYSAKTFSGMSLGTLLEAAEYRYLSPRPVRPGEILLVSINYTRLTGTTGRKYFRVFGIPDGLPKGCVVHTIYE